MSPRVMIAAPMLMLLIGCARGPRTSTPTPAPSSAATLESIAGGYALVAIDGRSLPFVPLARGQDANASAWPVVAGSLRLRSDGVFMLETSYDTNVDGVQRSFAFTGTCFGAGAGFRMVWEGGGQTGLSVRADTLVVNKEGILYSYVRR